MKIMFVCTGNTCRSPMAHAIMLDMVKKQNIEDIEIESSGTYPNEGEDMSFGAKEALKNMDIEFDHKARQITKNDLDSYDYIICMTKSHKDALSAYATKNNLFTMDELAHLGDIIDPFNQPVEVYKKTAEQIKNSLKEILKTLEK